VDITPLVPGSLKVIQGYGDCRFRISGKVHEGSVLIFPEFVVSWDVADVSTTALTALVPLVAETEIELLLLGTGKTAFFLEKTLRQAFREHGIVLEGMDTGAACRTYNVLATEGRRVAAALIAVD